MSSELKCADSCSGKQNCNFAADFKINTETNGEYIKDMYCKLDGENFGELSYEKFMLRLIKELQVNRKHGYVRLFLYPQKKDFDGRYFAIFIRKRDLYVVGVQDIDGSVYEVGTEQDGERYFKHSNLTGFGQKYKQLFGNDGKLYGIEIGFEVLNKAILSIIRNRDPLCWAWSIGIFALMFSECARFVWFQHKLFHVMAEKKSISMQGPEYEFMSVLPKKWGRISRRARMKPSSNEPELKNLKYTKKGVWKLQDHVQWAIDSLSILTWQYARGGGDGSGYGNGGGSYALREGDASGYGNGGGSYS